MKTVATVQEEAEVRVAEAKAQAEGETEAFRSDYPTRLNFPYRLEDKAIKWPFLVEGMWNDGQFNLPSLQRPGDARAVRRKGRQTGDGCLRS